MIRPTNSIHSANSIRHTENRSSHALPKISKLSNTYNMLSVAIAAGILITAGIVALALSSSLAVPCLAAGGMVFLGAVVLMAMNGYKKAQQSTKINENITLTSINYIKSNQAFPSTQQEDPVLFPTQSLGRTQLGCELSENERKREAIEQFQTRLEQAACKLQALQERYFETLKTALENQKQISVAELTEKRRSLNRLIQILNNIKNKPLRQRIILTHQGVKEAYLQNLIQLSFFHEVLLKTEKYANQTVSKEEAKRIICNLTTYKSLVAYYYSDLKSEKLFIDLAKHVKSINALTRIKLQRLPSSFRQQRAAIRFTPLSDTSENEGVEETSF